jgi:uncharacterized protein (TIGR02145 family)
MLSFSQNVAINADGTAPANSAMLDVKSTSKGFLLPRMTQAQRDAIDSPANSLMVFCTDCGTSGALVIYSNGSWGKYIKNECMPGTPTFAYESKTATSVTWVWNTAANAIGYKWHTANNYAAASDMGSNTNFPETGLTCNTSYTRYVWAYTDCGHSGVLTMTESTNPGTPNTFLPKAHVSTTSSITFNWNSSTGATSYAYSSTPDFATASNIGNVTTYTETGLTAFTNYTRYVWAVNNCGQTPAVNGLILRTGTQAEPCSVATVDYGGITYHTLQVGTQCWLQENLNIGTRINNYVNQNNTGTVEKYCHTNLESNCDAYGGLYQWDEAMQYVTTEGAQGICPSGWHIPSNTEATAFITQINTTYQTSTNGTTSVNDYNALCESGATYWSGNYGTNNSAFKARGAAQDGPSGSASLKSSLYLHTSTLTSSLPSTIHIATSSPAGTGALEAGWLGKAGGRSVRCIKD